VSRPAREKAAQPPSRSETPLSLPPTLFPLFARECLPGGRSLVTMNTLAPSRSRQNGKAGKRLSPYGGRMIEVHR
jgi:hypothetical protein